MTTESDPVVESATEASAAPTNSASNGNGLALGALLSGVAALLFAGPIAVVAWPFMIATIVFVVLAHRRGAGRRWMSVAGIVLIVIAALVSLVMPLLTMLVGLAMFGEVAAPDVMNVFWFYWSGQYLFAG